jgi:hypothetical protein
MSLSSSLKAVDQTGWLVITVVGIIIVYEVFKPSGNSSPNAVLSALGFPDPNDTTGDPNSIGDTSSSAYAGASALGWLANIANKLTGGVLQSTGNAIGSGIANASCGYDPNDSGN